jgi:hypothetical protein
VRLRRPEKDRRRLDGPARASFAAEPLNRNRSRRLDRARGKGRVVDRVVDLSHPIEHGVRTYPRIPSPEIGDHLTRAASRAHYVPGTEFHFGRISLVGNSGT